MNNWFDCVHDTRSNSGREFPTDMETPAYCSAQFAACYVCAFDFGVNLAVLLIVLPLITVRVETNYGSAANV